MRQSNLKQRTAAALAALLILSLAAFASAQALSPAQITGRVENGVYTLTVPLDPADEGVWQAKDPDGEDSAVRLAWSSEADGQYQVRYEPVRDGLTTVYVLHMDGGVCDRIYGFDLAVTDGKITEAAGGSFTVPPEEDELTPFITGEWAEKDTQVLRLTVTKAAGKGWQAELVSPLTHEAFVLRALIRFDCELDAFVYRDGSLFDLPADGEPGEPVQTGLSGSFSWTGDEETGLDLMWAADGREAVFERAEPAE